jgi:hypothetical protein
MRTVNAEVGAMVALMLAMLAPLALIALAGGAIRVRGGYERCPTRSYRTAVYCTTARPTANRP